MLDDFERALGADGKLSRQLFPQIAERILGFLAASLEEWRAAGYPRYKDGEDYFTVVVADHFDQVCRRAGTPYRAHIENLELTLGMRNGTEDVKVAGRMDVAVRWMADEDPKFTVEFKRLGPGSLAKAYVYNGMERFVSGKYAPNSPVANMIGYVVAGKSASLVVEVNGHADAAFGAGHDLRQTPTTADMETYMSQHDRSPNYPPIRLSHFFFDVQDRPPLPKV